MSWQPIEAMPKEGNFLAWCPFGVVNDGAEFKLLQAAGFVPASVNSHGGRFVVAKKTHWKRRRRNFNVTDVNSPRGEQYLATHWMPLPEPPIGEPNE